MNQYTKNPRHTQNLNEHQARYATNQITKALRAQQWHEDQNKLYLKGVAYNPDIAFVIPEDLLIRWEKNLNPIQTKHYDDLLDHRTMLPYTSRGNNQYRKNQSAKQAPEALLSLTKTLFLLGQLEVGSIVKFHWMLINELQSA